MITRISVLLLIISSCMFMYGSSDSSQARMPTLMESYIDVSSIDSPIIKAQPVLDSFKKSAQKFDNVLVKSKDLTRKIGTQQVEMIKQADVVDKLVDRCTDCKDTVVIIQRKGFAAWTYKLFHKKD